MTRLDNFAESTKTRLATHTKRFAHDGGRPLKAAGREEIRQDSEEPVRHYVLGSYVLGLLVITVLTLMVHNLRTSFDAALDTAGSLQVRFIECEGDRLKLQASLQSCSTTETLKLDDAHDTEYRRASARNE
jgi:hypothetical protein